MTCTRPYRKGTSISRAMGIRRLLAVGFILLLWIPLVGCNALNLNQEEEGPPKVGLILMSSPDELHSEGYYGYLALKALELRYGVEIAYNENVTSEDGASYLLSSYGKNGYDLVIAVGEMFTGPMETLAGSYPSTQFVCINGSKSADNLTSYDLPDEDLAYLSGALTAAMSTGQNTIGLVLPEGEASMVDSFRKGAAAIRSGIGVTEFRVKGTASFEELVGNLNVSYIRSVGLYVNSGDLETKMKESGISAAVVGGYRGATEPSRASWPRIAFDYTLMFSRVYEDYLGGKLGGVGQSMGFREKFLYVDSLAGIDPGYKAAVDGIIAGLK